MKNYLGDAGKKDGKISIIPVPYEGTCSHMTGCADAPKAIIKASDTLELYDGELDVDISKLGIRTLNEIDPEPTPEEMVDEIEAVVASEVLKGRKPVILGGCHTVTLGAVKALSKRYNKMSVLSFDAHADLKEKYDGTPLSHASIMARVNEICSSATIGVRSHDHAESVTIKNNKNPVLFAKDIVCKDDWHDKVIDALSDNVYITFDMDAFDISLMPATGTPEPGGLFWYDAMKFLKKVCEKKNIIGFDVVELMPIKRMEAYNYLATKLVYKIIGYSWHE